jgi:hypothetical protein
VARPSTVTTPEVGACNPATISSRVDLPQPDGPTSPSTSPAATRSDSSSSAATLPRRDGNSFESSATATAGWAGAALAIGSSLSGALTDIVLLAPFAGITPQVRRVSAGNSVRSSVRS